MDGLSEVREKLEAIKVATEPTTNLPLKAGRRIVHGLAREILALLEGEPSEQMRRDHEAMEKLRADRAGGAGPSLVFDDSGSWTYSFARPQPIAEKPDVITTVVLAVWAADPADAVLVTPTDGEGT